MDECILHTMNIETFDYNPVSLVGEASSKGMGRHQNAKSFNCGRYVRREYCRHGIPRNNISSRNGKNKRIQPLGICRKCSKDLHCTNECRATKERQGNPIPLGNSLGVLLQASKSKVVQSLLVAVKDMSYQEN